jgi:hypothetical protein
MISDFISSKWDQVKKFDYITLLNAFMRQPSSEKDQ